MWVGTLPIFRRRFQEAHPERVDLRAVLEEVPDARAELVPQVHQLPEAAQSVERGVCLEGKQRETPPLAADTLQRLRARANPGGETSHRKTPAAVANVNEVIYP